MEEHWPKEVRNALDLLANLPQVRYAFVPGFNRNPEGNSAPASRIVRDGGELALVNVFQREPALLRDIFHDYELSLVTDGNGYTCVRGVDASGNIRELAPAIKAYYADDDARELIRRHFTPDESQAL